MKKLLLILLFISVSLQGHVKLEPHTHVSQRMKEFIEETDATVTADSPLEIFQTWNNAGVAFTAVKIDGTSTLAAAGSKWFDIWNDGASVFSVGETGQLLVSDGTAANVAIAFNQDVNTGFHSNVDGRITAALAGTDAFTLTSNFGGDALFRINSGYALAWSSGSSTGGTTDLILNRVAADTLGLYRDGFAQTLQVYSDLGDPAGNYERGSFAMSTDGDLTISTENGAGGTTGIILLDATAQDIRILTNGTLRYRFLNSTFFPVTTGLDLGTSSDPWDNLFLGTSLDIKAAAGSNALAKLNTAELTIVDGDKLGQIDFAAPDDSAGGDANLVAASIWAEADDTFSAILNDTDLVFATGLSETAFEKMRLTGAGQLQLNTAHTTGTLHNFSMIPTGVLIEEAVWHGLHIDGAALDPSGTGAEISGIEVDLSGVSQTNDPVMHGIEINMPIGKDAIHVHEGQSVFNNTPTSTATSEFTALDVRVDTINLAATSAWAALSVTAVGASSGSVDAVIVKNEAGAIRQEVAGFAIPSQTEFAGRKITGGTVWADGVDGVEIFVVDDDEVYIGAAAQFSQIEVIMGTPATKDVVPTFWYNTAADTWTQFFPVDSTSGFQTSSLITWVPSSISGLWTNNGDPGGADTTAGYWIKIIRTRNADPGTPTPTTMKYSGVITHSWNSDGDIAVRSLSTVDSASTLAAAATVIAVTSNFATITGDGGANTIATITGGRVGMLLNLLFVDALVTITDDNTHATDSVDLNAAFTSADDTVLQLIHNGTSWYEAGSRSVN